MGLIRPKLQPLLVIAGTFATQRVSEIYYSPIYPTKVIALPNGGSGPLHRTYAALLPAILAWVSQQDGPVVVVGHSQGAIHALAFALDYPHLVDSVVGIAGPYDGANSPRIPANLHRHVKRVVPVALDMQRGSAYLLDLQEKALQSEGPPLSLIAGKNDRLVTPESAHAVLPSMRILLDGGHTTVLHQREVRHILKRIRSKEIE